MMKIQGTVAGVILLFGCGRHDLPSPRPQPLVQRVATAIDIYEVDNLRLPTNLTELVGEAHGTGPYMASTNREGQFRDEWGTELRYSPSGNRYELRSAGPDRRFETSDDLIIGPNRASHGTALPRRP